MKTQQTAAKFKLHAYHFDTAFSPKHNACEWPFTVTLYASGKVEAEYQASEIGKGLGLLLTLVE